MHLLMQADVVAFNAFSQGDRIYVGTCSEGEAVLLPPGFIFCDLAAYSGVCGLKLAFTHRGSLQNLVALKQDHSIFAATNGDSTQTQLLDFAIQDMFFVCVCLCACVHVFSVSIPRVLCYISDQIAGVPKDSFERSTTAIAANNTATIGNSACNSWCRIRGRANCSNIVCSSWCVISGRASCSTEG